MLDKHLIMFSASILGQFAGKSLTQSRPNPLLLSEGQRLPSSNSLQPEVNQDIIFEDVDVVTPSQKMLARKLTLRVPFSKSLLVTGDFSHLSPLVSVFIFKC